MKIGALDIGYGNLKTALPLDSRTDKKEIITPSLVELAQDDGNIIGIGPKRNTIRVTVGDTLYEVGEETSRIGKDIVKVLHADFIGTDVYRALFHAGLLDMQCDSLHTLVSGLPVSQLNNKAETLKELMTGTHKVTEDRSITVENAVIIPQPLGGYIQYAYETGVTNQVKKWRVLIIDIGHFSFDWLLLDKMTPNLTRSGTQPVSVGKVIDTLRNRIKKIEGEAPSSVELDEAIRSGKFVIQMYGKTYNFTKHLRESVREVARSNLSALKNSIGESIDIHKIIVIGGGANLFFNVIQEGFTRHELGQVKNPAMANVTGYRRYGEIINRNMKKAS